MRARHRSVPRRARCSVRTDLHALLPESLFSLRLDLRNSLHGLNRLAHEFTIILNRSMSQSLEVEGLVHDEFLAVRLAERLCPFELARVTLGLEIAVAFGTTETKHLGIIAGHTGTRETTSGWVSKHREWRARSAQAPRSPAPAVSAVSPCLSLRVVCSASSLLCCCVVPHEHDTMSRVAGGRAEIALLETLRNRVSTAQAGAGKLVGIDAHNTRDGDSRVMDC